MNSHNHLEFDKLLSYINSLCHSLPGKKYLSTFHQNNDKEFLLKRLNIINNLQKYIIREKDYNFDKLSDIAIILNEINTLTFNFEEFYEIIWTVKIGNALLSDLDLNSDFIDDYKYYLDFIKPLVALYIIEERFHQIFDEEGNVLDTASVELKNIRQRIRKLNDKIQKELQKTINDAQINNYLQDKIVTKRNERYVVPVKESFTFMFDGISHGRSSSGASVYIEPKNIVPLNNEINDLVSEEKKEIYRIFCEFTKQIRDEKDKILINFDIISKLDTYFAAARVSNELHAIVPELIDDYRIELYKARHPLLIIKFKNMAKVIPFNISLGTDFKVLLLSGPNTGGKSITLKTIGLCILMALTGLPIPADYGSKIGLFSKIFADIGDNQSIESSLSTFSGHIENIKEIINLGDEQTVILIDEIGSATDPQQGAAIAQAILENIVLKKSIAVITTHYTALKIFVENTPLCVNASMLFDPEKHEPTYKFVLGFPGNSFAIEIAAKLGLNDDLIQRAKYLSGTQNVELTDLLTKMNEEKKKLAKNNYELELKTRLMQMKTDELEAIIKNQEIEKKKIIKSKLSETQNYLTGIQKQIYDEFNEIKKLDKNEKKVKLNELENTVTSFQKEIIEKKEKLEPKISKNQTLKIGDTVWIKSLETNAVIKDKKNEIYKVDMNGILFNVKKSDLIKIIREKSDEIINVVSVKRTIESEKAKLEINLLGKTFEEALPLVQDLIDNAILTGLSKVRIVHGRGTGVLRKKIRDYLKNNKKIIEFYSPPQEAGGDGVTVVSLA